jgi:hypothetical protein
VAEIFKENEDPLLLENLGPLLEESGNPALAQLPAFAAGFAPRPSDMNRLIQQPFQFLTSKVMFRAQLQSAQALTGGADTLIHFGATAGDILEDPYGGWSTTLTASQPAWSWLCPSGLSGAYEITMTAFTANPAGGNTRTVIYLDGVSYLITNQIRSSVGTPTGCCGPVDLALIGTVDYVQGYIFTTTGVNTIATTGQFPTLEICWVSL